MAPRGTIEATVEIEGLKALDRDLKRLHPEVQKELKTGMKGIASKIAREATTRAHARSFVYRGAGTGTKASVRSAGPKGYVARFLEFGFHPRGSSTFVEGRNIVGSIIEREEQEIIDAVGDLVDQAARQAGWH